MNFLIAIKNFAYIRWIKKYKSRKNLEDYQNKKLEKHLLYIKKHSPYYKNIDSKDLSSIEIIDKKIMMDNFNIMNTVNADKEECLNIAINSEHTRDFSTKYKNLSVGLSSGTSGHRGLFVLSDKEIMQWAGAILAKVLPKGKLFGNRIAFFLRADNNLYESINSIFVKFEFFDLLDDFSKNIQRLKEFNPTILVAPASILKLIGKEIVGKSITQINPIKIISVAEVLTKSDERFIKKAFNKDIIHQVYQCTEGFLAYTCEKGCLHFNEDIVKIEKEKIDETRFVPIVTDFYRKTQPIIRYRLNDVIISTNQKCDCGLPFMVIDEIEGREDDIFIFEGVNGKDVLVHGDFISRCLVYVDDILEYRVFQVSKQLIQIYIDTISDEIKNNIINEFNNLSVIKGFILPDITFEKYTKDNTKKMKRIERGFKYEKA